MGSTLVFLPAGITLFTFSYSYSLVEGIILRLATQRKSIRRYKSRRIDISKVLYAIEAALQAPSGANQQPWRFIIIDSPAIKASLREVCERGEKEFYMRVKGELKEWLSRRHFDWRKPFLVEAPYIIAVFAELGKPYSIQSTWLAIGYLLLALEEAGLASLTYTPPNPQEISRILDIPNRFMLQTLIPVGLPREYKAKEPRKKLSEVTFYNTWGKSLTR